MRSVLAWLVMFGVLAGLSARALPAHLLGAHAHGHEHVAAVVDSCGGHHHPGEAPCGHDDSEHPDQPCHDPHHHHSCCSPVTFTSEHRRECRLSPPGGVLIGFSERREPVPDSPYLEREAPPLI